MVKKCWAAYWACSMEKTDTALNHDEKYAKLYRVVTEANKSAKHVCE